MTTITPPQAYSSVRQPVIFKINHDKSEAIEVSINGFVKTMPRNTDSVNASNYCIGDFDVRPIVTQGAVIEVYSGRDLARVYDVTIWADGTTSAAVPLIDASRQPEPGRMMSELRRRIIARGDMDEIPVYLSAPAKVDALGLQADVAEGVSVVGLRIPDDAPERFAVRLLSAQGDELDRIDYELASSDGVRLAWVNPLGEIDYWQFPFRIKSAAKITKDLIYSDQGYMPTSVQAEATQTVSTGVLSEKTIDALMWMCMAERVWRIEQGVAYPVDITSEAVTTYSAEKLSALEVNYRDNIRML